MKQRHPQGDGQPPRVTCRLLAELKELLDHATKELKPVGLTAEQYRVLSAVNRLGSVTVNGVAKTLASPYSTNSEMLARLTRAGYLQKKRSEKDGRMVYLALTPAGFEVLRLWHLRSEEVPTALSRLSEDEQVALEEALNAALRLLKK